MLGVLLINKPKDFSSHDIVNILRKKLNIKKIGHTGTLDPNATGVLPILIGNATKISKFLIEHDKTYVAILKLGQKTDTADSKGNIIKEDKNVKNVFKDSNYINDIEKVLQSFIGKQEQIPPIYSAIKINGKKLYEYARKNEKVEIKSRQIEIYKIKIMSVNKERFEIKFEIKCSKGTYIRTLCEDIAKKLGTIGILKELERTKINEFDINQSISLEDLEKMDIEEIEKHVINIESIFKDKEKIILKDNNDLKKFLNGVKLKYNLPDGTYKIYNKEKFIGIAIMEKGLLKRDLILINTNLK